MSSFKDEETEIKSRVCKALIRHTHICVCYSESEMAVVWTTEKERMTAKSKNVIVYSHSIPRMNE